MQLFASFPGQYRRSGNQLQMSSLLGCSNLPETMLGSWPGQEISKSASKDHADHTWLDKRDQQIHQQLGSQCTGDSGNLANPSTPKVCTAIYDGWRLAKCTLKVHPTGALCAIEVSAAVRLSSCNCVPGAIKLLVCELSALMDYHVLEQSLVCD